MQTQTQPFGGVRGGLDGDGIDGRPSMVPAVVARRGGEIGHCHRHAYVCVCDCSVVVWCGVVWCGVG